MPATRRGSAVSSSVTRWARRNAGGAFGGGFAFSWVSSGGWRRGSRRRGRGRTARRDSPRGTRALLAQRRRETRPAAGSAALGGRGSCRDRAAKQRSPPTPAGGSGERQLRAERVRAVAQADDVASAADDLRRPRRARACRPRRAAGIGGPTCASRAGARVGERRMRSRDRRGRRRRRQRTFCSACSGARLASRRWRCLAVLAFRRGRSALQQPQRASASRLESWEMPHHSPAGCRSSNQPWRRRVPARR